MAGRARVLLRMGRLFGYAMFPVIWAVAAREEPQWPGARGEAGVGSVTLRPPLARQASILGVSLTATDQLPSVATFDQVDAQDEAEASHLASLATTQSVCIASTADFAGELGDVLAYRVRRSADRIWVSYFAYWTEERPWGDEPWLNAMLIDAVYSRLLFALPGSQYVLYGPGDVEGARVEYQLETDETGAEHLVPLRAFADDKGHRDVELEAVDVRGSQGRTWLLTNAWSHQLGARQAARVGEQLLEEHPEQVQCFDGAALVPMTRQIAADFRLGSPARPRRARPAWH